MTNIQHIEVTTRDLNDLDAPPQSMVINDKNKLHMYWLEKHLFWAVRTGKVVRIEGTNKAVTFIDRKAS